MENAIIKLKVTQIICVTFAMHRDYSVSDGFRVTTNFTGLWSE